MPATTPHRPLPAEVREKAGKYLLLLSSSHAGEQAAAADALGRLLKAHGLDWHDLATAITAAPTAAAAQPSPSPSRPEPSPRASGGERLPADELSKLIAALHESGTVYGRSLEFLDSLSDRCDRYSTVLLSPKQWKWLCDLVARAGIL